MSESTSDVVRASGQWAGGEVAALVPVLLELREGHLWVVSIDGATTFARWPVSTLRLDAMHEGSLAHIESSSDPDRTATTGDAAFLAALRAAGARRSGLPLRRRGVLALACAAAVVAIFGGLYAVMPWVSRAVAQRVPLDVERRLQPRFAGLFESRTCHTPDAQAALVALRDRLDPTGSIHADVRVVNLDVPNAFALPGGTVLLTRALVEGAESGEEVAGVLAHEMAHVYHRHVLAELIQDTFMSSVWAATMGDYSAVLVVDPRTLEHLIELRQSRDVEAEADRTGLAMLADARVSPAGLAAFLERNSFAGGEGALTFLSTHPATANRLQMIRSAPAVEGPPVLTGPQLDALRKACAGEPEIRSLRDLIH
jgi:beta-barrel assembly-enhancing protease